MPSLSILMGLLRGYLEACSSRVAVRFWDESWFNLRQGVLVVDVIGGWIVEVIWDWDRIVYRLLYIFSDANGHF